MKTKTLGWLLAVGIVGGSFAACSQPQADCQVALASTTYAYVVKYTVKNSPACTDKVKIGELIGMESYHPPSDDNTTYNPDITTVALQSDDLGYYSGNYASVGFGDPCAAVGRCEKDADCFDDALKCTTGFCVSKSCSASEPHQLWGLGKFETTSPSADNFCSIKTTSAAQQDLVGGEDTLGAGIPDTQACTTDADCQIPADPEDPESMVDPASGSVCDTTAGTCKVGCRATDENGDPAPNSCVAPFSCDSADNTVGKCVLAPAKYKYEWKNLKFYVTAAAPGTQFTGDLTYTEDGCTIEYSAIGMWPAVYCINEKGEADDTLCSPCPDSEAGRVYGSGINPDFPVKCDPDMGYCTLRNGKDLTKDADSIPQFLPEGINCNE
ncbi:Putative lipoprotein mlpA precursor [Minicystis rosea]|nr:Putative lipoprotein mlpA precursor [Minicystis rosea]